MRNAITRKNYPDIARALLIISVVMGHSYLEFASYIFWFHMPAFFMLSGYLYKDQTSNMIRWIKLKVFKYMVPYISFFILLVIVPQLILSRFSIKTAIQYFAFGLYGGRVAPGVYWFITCMLITLLIYSALSSHIKRNWILWAIMLGFYILAHLESLIFIPVAFAHIGTQYISFKELLLHSFPWNADVALLSIVYFHIGNSSKKVLDVLYTRKPIQLILFIILTLVAAMLFYLNYTHLISYSFDMKYSNYRHIIWDGIIPLIISLDILIISMFLESIKTINNILSYIGRNTIAIMYIHFFLRDIFTHNGWLTSLSGNIIFIVMALCFSLLCACFIRKIKILRTLFLGDIVG